MSILVYSSIIRLFISNISKTPNAYHHDYEFFALRDILAGEEITVDYDTLEEVEEYKEEFYKE